MVRPLFDVVMLALDIAKGLEYLNGLKPGTIHSDQKGVSPACIN